MTRCFQHHKRHVALVGYASLLVTLAGCGGSDPDEFSKTHSAQLVNYEVVAGSPQRVMVGLSGTDGTIIGFGKVTFGFAYAGTATKTINKPKVTKTAEATYLLVAGQKAGADVTGPRAIEPSDGVGVYKAEVTLDEPGFWDVQVTAVIDGKTRQLHAGLEVLPKAVLPGVGDPAPRTVNRLPGDPSLPAKAIDSRADEAGTVPDPQLHARTIADAIAAQQPVLVAVTTPVYCQSRFCGPITDLAQQLAVRYGDRMTFSHIEVWNDFDGQAINREAAEWILRDGTDTHEPWVFLVDGTGTIVNRWDNITNETELTAAIDKVLA